MLLFVVMTIVCSFFVLVLVVCFGLALQQLACRVMVRDCNENARFRKLGA